MPSSYPFAQHEAEDYAVSSEIVDAIRTALPEGWGVVWSMTGGGCSAWEVIRDERDLSLMLTGLDDTTEASGNLTRGILIGAYGDEGGIFLLDEPYIGSPESNTPAEHAEQVNAALRILLAKDPETYVYL